ncbi:MAG: hypothetical protein IKW39_04690 [Alphaproteobacteria bacterium]|nr:hypothetical protein [Alphaproteobacteria bacterium]
MVVQLIKQAVVLALIAIYFHITETSFIYAHKEHIFKLDIFESLFFVFLIFLAFEAFLFFIGQVIKLIKKDVLLSNKNFYADKDSIEVIQSLEKDKLVLARSQFDEAAILIVKAMGSITSGLMNEARRSLVCLRKIIGDDAIIDILMLKIYKGEKNFDKMEQLSQKLIQNEDIQLVGMKAALEAQIEKKEFSEALKTVNKAFEVRQDLYWVIGSAFLLRAQNKDWLGALEVLESGIDKNIIPSQKANRLKAVSFYELAKQAKNDGDQTKFYKFINQALTENPKLIPAALDLANYYIENDKQKRKAERVLSKIWAENPSYETAISYLDLYKKDTISERIQRMEKLAISNSKRPSLNNLILAELYIKAKKYAKARTECKIFLLKNPATEKIASLLAILDKKTNKKTLQNNKDIVIDYPRDFQWVCANCGSIHEKWEPICDKCDEIGRIYWHLYTDNKPSEIEDSE